MKKVYRPEYEKKLSSTFDQFTEDFGLYPPVPLSGGAENTNFKVFYVSSIGGIFYYIERYIRLRRSSSVNRVGDTAELNDLKKIDSLLNEFKLSFAKLSALKKIIMIAVFLTVSPAIILMIAVVLFKAIYSCCKIYFAEQKSMGSFLPVIKNDLEIMVSSKYRGSDIGAAIRSHEHIHLRQYICALNSNADSDSFDKVKLNNKESILQDRFIDSRTILYIMEAREMEARLHELVLSYYRETGFLPVSPQGFFSLLASEKRFSIFMGKVLGQTHSITHEDIEGRFSIRNDQALDEIFYALLSIKSKELQSRYIAEVLLVMYGKLLEYYGDSAMSGEFLSKIDRPNLYDTLYG